MSDEKKLNELKREKAFWQKSVNGSHDKKRNH